MLTHDELCRGLIECLQSVAALLEHARKAARDEQDALLDNDAEALVRSCTAQEEVLRRIGEADQRAAELATQIAANAGLDADTMPLAEVVGHPFDRMIQVEMESISVLAREVKEANVTNRRLLENGVDIITCCMRTLACGIGSQSYSRDAAISDSQPCVLSLDRKA